MKGEMKENLPKWLSLLKKLDDEQGVSYLEEILDCRYDEGYIDGLTAFAWWGDGVQYVGTSGKTLEQAIAERRKAFNYVGEKE